jgi:ABC-type branched-subunit amino acid transport system ATPase component
MKHGILTVVVAAGVVIQLTLVVDNICIAACKRNPTQARQQQVSVILTVYARLNLKLIHQAEEFEIVAPSM